MRDPQKRRVSKLRYEQSEKGRSTRENYIATIGRVAHTRYNQSEKGLKRQRDYQKSYRNKPENRIKLRARDAARRALKRGDLVRQPCKCGEKKVQMHHEDYTKPLEVIWLCVRCHHKVAL